MRALTTIYTIWLRDFKGLVRERSRVIAMVGQPLLYLLIVGTGINAGMRLNGSPQGVDYLKFMYPGIIGMSILFTSMFSGISIIWDREFGFLKEVLVAPVPRWGVALGKSLGGATVSLFQSAILILLAPVAGIRLTAPVIAGMLALSFLISFAVTSFAVAIASRMTSMQGFQMVMNFLIMPLYFLSGGMFPMATSPGWMKALMVLDPLTYGVDALRNVVFSGTVVKSASGDVPLLELARQAGLVQWALGFDALVLMIAAVALAGLGAWSFSTAE